MTTSRTALFRFHSTLSMLFILLIASFAEIAGAESSLDWQMKMLEAVEGKRNVKITLRGHSSGEFSLKANELFHLTQQKTVSKVSDSSIENFFPMKVKEGEVRDFVITLPPGLVQVPLLFRDNKGKEKSFLMSLTVDLTSDLPQKFFDKPVIERDVYIWGGLGSSYLRYKQNSTVTVGELSFKTLETPSLSFSGELGLTDTFYFSSFLNVAPGSVSPSASLSFREENYYWIIYGLEGVHFPNKLKYGKFRLGYRFGGQMHQLPFISRTTTNGVGNIETNSLANISAGPMVVYQISDKWKIHSYIRLQYPIFWGFLFDVEPQLNFDGNITLFWKPNLESNWSYSLRWFGQSQKFDYTTTDVLLQGESTGTIDLFFSGIDLRIGYQF